MFLDDTSCNLGSNNLLRFWDSDVGFYTSRFQAAIALEVIAMDIMISPAVYPTQKIAERTKLYRTLGVGYTNLGALLLANALPYNSRQARNYAAAITALMHFSAYAASSDLAAALAPFDRWKANKDGMLRVLSEHAAALDVYVPEDCKEPSIFLAAKAVKERLLSKGKNLSFRNAQVTVLAPTGTIAFLMDCDTTSIEPILFLVTYKKLVGGGEMILTIPSAKLSMQKLGYSEEDIAKFTKFIAEHNTVVGSGMNKTHYKVFQTAFGDDSLSADAHLQMMAAVQPFLSGAISKTVNLPNSATVEDIAQTYLKAWKLGLKAVALYRDGCKGSQPLSGKSEKNKITDLNIEAAQDFLSNGRPKPVRKKLANTREAKTHKFSVGGHEGYLTSGFYDDSVIGEFFLRMAKEGSTISGLADAWATTVSIGLQYGIPLSVFVNKLKGLRFEPQGLTENENIRFATSLVDYVMRYLELQAVSFDKDAHLPYESALEASPVSLKRFSGDTCSRCGGLTYKTGTCNTCSSCGDTGGCG